MSEKREIAARAKMLKFEGETEQVRRLAEDVLTLLGRVDDAEAERATWFGENSRAQAALGRIRELARDEQLAMDLWWRTTGDDWPVPETLPGRFLRAALAERDHVAEAAAIRKQRQG